MNCPWWILCPHHIAVDLPPGVHWSSSFNHAGTLNTVLYINIAEFPESLFSLIEWALHNSMHALRLRSHSTAVQLQSTGFRETKNDRRAYLSLRIVCNSRTWSFILIILRLGPNSAGFCHSAGFSSGMSLRPFVNSQSSAVVMHLSDVSEASVVFCVPFCSLTFTRSGIIWKTELIHPHKQENIT